MGEQKFAVEALESRRLMAASVPAGFVDEQIVSGLSSPTCAEFLPDGRALIAEQGGTLRVVKGGQLLATPALTLNTDPNGERGLLGVAADPGFEANHYVYLYYTVPGSPAHNRVARYTMNGDVLDPASEMTLTDLDALSSATNHNGGSIHFGPDGKLYVGVGENGLGANAQSMSTRLGKLLRINPDGSIPTDNPFYNSAGGDNRQVWALGLRNPFSFAFQPGTGLMYIDDVGQATYEEIDVGRAGANYGWPVTEGPTTDSRFVGPIYSYTHADGSTAITAGTFYNPSTVSYPGSYVGSYFFTDLTGDYIKRLLPGTATATPFATGVGNPVDLDVGPDGSLYYLDIVSGQWRRIREASAPPKVTLGGVKAGARFDAGTKYTLTASAVAADKSVVNAGGFAWTVQYVDGDVVRQVLAASGKQSIAFTPGRNRTSATGFYRVSVTATDRNGLARTVVRDFKPHLVKVTVKTSAPGVTASLSGLAAVHARTVKAVAGSRVQLSTAAHQRVGIYSYVFSRWSDGVKKASRVLTVPAGGGTVTAQFVLFRE